MTRLIFFLLFFIIHLPAHSATEVPGVEFSYFYDAHATRDIASISDAPFQPFEKSFSLGWQPGAVWLRLKIQADASGPKPLLIRIGPYFLDTIEFYEQAAGQWQQQRVGARYAAQSKICSDDFHCFELYSAGNETKTVYFKIQNRGLMMVKAELLPYEALAQATALRVMQIAVSLTLSACLLLLGIAAVLKYRSLALQVFCLSQASVFFFLCGAMGFFPALMPAVEPETLLFIGYGLFLARVFFVILLGWTLIQPYQTPASYHFLVFCLLCFCLIGVGLVAAGEIGLALKINTIVFSINPLVQLFGVAKARLMPTVLRSILLLSYTVYAAMAIFGALSALGFLRAYLGMGAVIHFADWRLNGSGVGFVFFLILLFVQSLREKEKAKEIIALRIEAAQAKSHEEKLMDRHTLIDLLTHELKNPLGTIKFAMASLRRALTSDDDSLRRVKHIDVCLNRMDDLIEHVARSSKIDRFEEFNQWEKISAAELLNELVDEYADTHRFDINVDPAAMFRSNLEMLKVVLENLISNAYKYAHTGSKIKIHIRQDPVQAGQSGTHADTAGKSGGTVCFEISNVVGIYAFPDPARMFDRYYRHPNAEGLSGMGIGLSLVKSAAQKIGASVQHQIDTHFVVFTVRIPN